MQKQKTLQSLLPFQYSHWQMPYKWTLAFSAHHVFHNEMILWCMLAILCVEQDSKIKNGDYWECWPTQQFWAAPFFLKTSFGMRGSISFWLVEKRWVCFGSWSRLWQGGDSPHWWSSLYISSAICAVKRVVLFLHGDPCQSLYRWVRYRVQ